MATVRLDMKRTREILRLKCERGLPHRQIARSLSESAGVGGSTLSRAKHAGLSPTTLDEVDDEQLERRLYGVQASEEKASPPPAPTHIHHDPQRPRVTPHP